MFERENHSPNREFGKSDDAPKDRASGKSDPFDDLDSLRLSQDFVADNGVKPMLSTIAVRKPNRQEFIRVRPGNEWRIETACFTDAATKEIFIVTPQLCDELRSDVKPTCLRTCISRNSPAPFVWPIGLPRSDGHWNRWHESAAVAAELAEKQWLKVTSNLNAGNYSTHVAPAAIPEPDWPVDLSLKDLIGLAFKGRIISSINHPVLRRLRGEI
tara:strand:- start:4632 stop:5273 length:642 start_codon:yes stop_codon:yes gene_type:complete